jgi:hypothetical protein
MGSGFKDWSPGDVLTAADVDGYLMRQTVMTFADASARDTALSGVLDEGMVAYLENTNEITLYNGSAWVSVIDADVLTFDTTNTRVGINDSTPSYTLDVNGDINATGDLRIAGTAIGKWTTFTPSWNNFTAGNAAQDWAYCIINDVMIVTGRTVLGDTSSMGSNPSFDIPAGKTADKWSRGSAILREDGVATLFGALSATGPGGSSIGVFRYEVSGSNIRSNLITSATPFNWGDSDYISGTLVLDVT